MKGFADTDMSLAYSKRKPDGLHKYPTISLQTSNTTLAKQLTNLLRELDFKSYVKYDFPKKRADKLHNSNLIDINGKDQLKKWMKEIGFSSPKHITKYEVWKKFGFCPPYTTLQQRIAFLDGSLDINKFYKKTYKHTMKP